MARIKPIKLSANWKQEQLLSSDTIPPENLGSGTASTGAFLRRDGTWVSAVPGGASVTSADLQAEVSNRISADIALSIAIAVVSSNLSLETSARLAADIALSNAVSVVSQALSLETAARVTGDSALSVRIDNNSAWVTSALQSLNNIGDVSTDGVADGQALVWNSAQGQWIASTIAGGGGSVTSAEYLSLVNRVSGNSTQMTSVDSVLGAAINSVDNRVSVLSGGLSAETVNRVSADDVLSTAISTKNLIITIDNQGSTLISNPTAIDYTGNAVSTYLSTGVVKVNISVAAGGASVTSAEYTSLVDRVSSNSAQMTSADNAISTAAANAQSTADAVSNRVSIFQVSGSMGNLAIHSVIDISAIAVPAAPSTSIVRVFAHMHQNHPRLEYLDQDGSEVVLAQDTVVVVKNVSGGPITRGQAVYISGGVGASGTPEVVLARADSISTMPAAGLVLESSIANNGFGLIMTVGELIDFNTSAFTEGVLVYVSETVAGDLTVSSPSYPNYPQAIGRIINVHATNGTMFIYPDNIRTPDTTSIIEAIASIVSTLSAHIETLSNAISVVSAAQATTSAAVTSVESHVNTVSNSLSIETASRISADNALSNAISGKNPTITIQNEGSVIQSAPTTIDFTGNAVSAYVSAGKIKTNISVTAGGSATPSSAQYTSLVNNVNAISGTLSGTIVQIDLLSVRIDTVSAETSGYLLSVYNAGAQIPAGSPVYLNSTVPAEVTLAFASSVYPTGSEAKIIGLTREIPGATSGIVQTTGQLTLSTTDWSVIIPSNALVRGKAYYLWNVAGMLNSIGDVQSANLVPRLVGYALTDTRFLIQPQGVDDLTSLVLSVQGQASSAAAIAGSAHALASAAFINNVATNSNLVSLANALDQEISVRSALGVSVNIRLNTISNAVSIVSAAQAVTSADLTSFKQSIDNFGDVSVTGALSSQVLLYRSASAQWVASTLPGGAASVTSAEYTSLVDRVSSNSTQMTSADNAISGAVVLVDGRVTSVMSAVSVESAARAAADTSLDGRITSVMSAVSVESAARAAADTSLDGRITSVMSAVSVESAARAAADTSLDGRITSVNTAVQTNSANFTSFAQSIDNIGDVSATGATSGQVLTFVSGQWIGASVPVTVGSVTSAEFIAIASGLGSPIQLRVVTNAQGISATTLGSANSRISGLSVSVSANGVYQLQGMVLYSVSAANGYRFALSNATATYKHAAGFWDGMISIGPAFNASTQAYFGRWNQNSFGSVSFSVVAATGGVVYGVKLEGVVALSTTGGTIQLKALTSAGTGSPITILEGSYVRAYKLR